MKKHVVVAMVLLGLIAVTFGATAQSNEPWIPGIASLVLPGLGQFLNDEMDKALIHLGVAVAIDVGMYYAVSLFRFGFYTYPLIGLAHLGWGLFSAYDAYTVAQDRGFIIGAVENGFGFALNF